VQPSRSLVEKGRRNGVIGVPGEVGDEIDALRVDGSRFYTAPSFIHTPTHVNSISQQERDAAKDPRNETHADGELRNTQNKRVRRDPSMNSAGRTPADVGGEPPDGRAKGQRALFRDPLRWTSQGVTSSVVSRETPKHPNTAPGQTRNGGSQSCLCLSARLCPPPNGADWAYVLAYDAYLHVS
jgi:hypothetical protein